MISSLRYLLWETSKSSANVSVTRQTDRANQVPKFRRSLLPGFEKGPDWFGRQKENYFIQTFAGLEGFFVLVNGILFMRQHFAFDFNLWSQTLALHLNGLRWRGGRLNSLFLKAFMCLSHQSPGQLPPVEQRPVLRSHHGRVGVWDRRGQHHRDRLRWRQSDSQRHQNCAEEGHRHHQRHHPPHQTGPHPWRRWAWKGRHVPWGWVINYHMWWCCDCYQLRRVWSW